jgi:hypothetical protein
MAKFSSAPSLLLGISARIFIDKFILNNDSPMRDFGLLGLWQGVAVYYAFTINYDFAVALSLILAVKLVIDLSSEHDITKFTSTILAAALGVIITDVLSRFLGDGLYHGQYRQHRSSPTKPHSNRDHDKKRTTKAVHFNRNGTADPVCEGTTNTRPPFTTPTTTHHHHRSPRRPSQSDITSLDSTSDFIGPQSSSLSPLDREVARLRARASLADTERRRYKEERKWAISQGNHARASQMTWEVKRYKALMQSFHREADALVIRGASNTRQNGTDPQRSSAPPERTSRSKPTVDIPTDRQPGLTNGESSNHRKQKSGR